MLAPVRSFCFPRDLAIYIYICPFARGGRIQWNPVPLEVERVLPAPFPPFSRAWRALLLSWPRKGAGDVGRSGHRHFSHEEDFSCNPLHVAIPFPRPREGCWSREEACTHQHCEIRRAHVVVVIVVVL